MSLWRRQHQPHSPTAVGCQEWVEIVTDYLEGHLDPALVEHAEAHLADCPGCVQYLEQMRLTVAELGRVPGERLSPRRRVQLLASFREWSGGDASAV